MGMTIAEKILARASGKSKVEPGEYIIGKVDLAMVHDLTGPLTLNVLKEVGYERPWDPEKIVIILDHQVPANSTVTASLHKQLREYADEYGTKFHDVGRQGVCHQILAESYVKPGMLVVGADSHTCTLGALGAFATGIGSTEMASVFLTGELWFRVPETIRFELKGTLKPGVSAKDIILYIIGKMGVDGALYCATEFTGEGVEGLSVDGRLTLCNMAIEMGGKTGIVNPDVKTLRFTNTEHIESEVLRSDKDAEYHKTMEVALEDLVPQVALPHSVDNVKPVSEVEGVDADQVFIGSCTNGRLEDLEAAAKILKGRKVKAGTRLIVIPASPSIYMEAERRGYIRTFIEAGGVVCNPNCGPCLGGHMGILADGEVCVSTSNRNFVGRMGSPKSKVYLVSPETAAATAVEGKLTDPLKYVRG
ncbi:MAG: 3-isopropylmalate dehydratase large subunit [Candidatus Verstraetearchaeota archaeon]|nr:3-isopropylmalate dehydratase large subunit [Candidatus Verstraetearchaeota archaeon]